MSSISLSHLEHTSNAYPHLLDNDQPLPVRESSRRRILGCFSNEIFAQRVEATVTSEYNPPIQVPGSDSYALTQRVRKYHSVPVLRLIPSDRPLFFCDNCCSANFFVPICLWCKWTSAAAAKRFKAKAPRVRTMSAPRSCSLKGGSNLKVEFGGALVPKGLDPRGSLDTDRSTEPPETPRSMVHEKNCSAITVMDDWVKVSAEEATFVCRSSRPLCFFDLMFWYAPPPISQPAVLTQPSYDPYHGALARHKEQRLSTVNFDNNRGSTTSSNRSAHILRSDDGHEYESQSFLSNGDPQGFRRSSDSRRSGTKSEGHVPRLARSPTRTRNTDQSSSPPPSLHRRPLYHYIRSRASDSHSTFDCGAVPGITPPTRPTTPQESASHFSRQSAEASPVHVDECRSRSSFAPSIAPPSRTGFSVSGETEQRMYLAKISHDGRFIFHESKPSKKRDRIMRGLRRSFKNFFSHKVDG